MVLGVRTSVGTTVAVFDQIVSGVSYSTLSNGFGVIITLRRGFCCAFALLFLLFFCFSSNPLDWNTATTGPAVRCDCRRHADCSRRATADTGARVYCCCVVLVLRWRRSPESRCDGDGRTAPLLFCRRPQYYCGATSTRFHFVKTKLLRAAANFLSNAPVVPLFAATALAVLCRACSLFFQGSFSRV